MWIAIAVACALFVSLTDTFSKLALRRTDEYIIGWLRQLVPIPVFAAILFFQDTSRIDPVFWQTIALVVPLELCGYFLYLKAIRRSPLSLTVPFMGISPVCGMLVSFLILGERYNLLGGAGVALVFLGTYLLNVEVVGTGILEPLKRIRTERGSFYMIGVALIYGATSVLGKRAIQHSSPVIFTCIYPMVLAALISPLALFRMKKGLSKLCLDRGMLLLYAAIAVAYIAAFLTHATAISMVQVSYFLSIKRLSILFGVFFGALVFKENIRQRIWGASVIMAGVVLIALA